MWGRISVVLVRNFRPKAINVYQKGLDEINLAKPRRIYICVDNSITNIFFAFVERPINLYFMTYNEMN